jgi:hypothetical protein
MAKKKSHRKESGGGDEPIREADNLGGRTTQAARMEREALREEEGSGAAGQSGDTQQLSDEESADPESVKELLEEGQAFEAGVVSGVEAAEENPDQEANSQEVPEDDLPGEYQDLREKEKE